MANVQSSSTAPESFIQIWINALTKPREATYAAIAASPRAKAMTAYVWVFLTSILTGIASIVVQGAQIRKVLESSGTGLGDGGGVGGVAIGLICFVPFGAVIGTLAFAIVVALTQWIAKMFGGTGNNDRLAYALAAIAAPYSVISTIFALPSMIPYIGLCFGLIAILGGLYVLVLQIMAVKSVNAFGWGPAIGSYVIPIAAILFVCCIALTIATTISGVALGSVLSSMNQSIFP